MSFNDMFVLALVEDNSDYQHRHLDKIFKYPSDVKAGDLAIISFGNHDYVFAKVCSGFEHTYIVRVTGYINADDECCVAAPPAGWVVIGVRADNPAKCASCGRVL